jgi:uncharacterized membrane protein SpoIIM required for sporulation
VRDPNPLIEALRKEQREAKKQQDDAVFAVLALIIGAAFIAALVGALTAVWSS